MSSLLTPKMWDAQRSKPLWESAVADFHLIARIENHVGIGRLQTSVGNAPPARIQGLVDAADRARRARVATQLIGDPS